MPDWVPSPLHIDKTVAYQLEVQTSSHKIGTLQKRYVRNVVIIFTMTICCCEDRILSPKAEMTEAEPNSTALKFKNNNG